MKIERTSLSGGVSVPAGKVLTTSYQNTNITHTSESSFSDDAVIYSKGDDLGDRTHQNFDSPVYHPPSTPIKEDEPKKLSVKA